MRRSRLLLLFSACLPALTWASDWTGFSLNPVNGESSEATGIGNTKQVGSVYYNFTDHAFVWSGTAASGIDLTPAGSTYSSALAAFGDQQGGYFRSGSVFRACIWNGTAASVVDLAPTNATMSEVLGMYSGKQVGFAELSGAYRASLWSGTKASFVDLHPSGAENSFARGGFGTRQVGDAEYSSVTKAVTWTGTAGSAVVLQPTGATSSSARGATATRQVGYAQFSGNRHAGYWTGSAASWTDLHPAGSSGSEALAAHGDMIVGNLRVSSSPHACIWIGSTATPVRTDLHTFLPAGYSQSSATAVFADATTIYVVGSAYNTTAERYEAVMWKKDILVEFAFTLNKTTVAGQNSVQGTITVDPAPGTPLVFATFDNSSLVTTPASVTVAAGTTVKNFQITVTAVTAPINTTIYAKYGAVTKAQPLTLAPLVPTALSFTPNPVVGGNSTVGKVVINGVAGPGGRTVAILDNSPNATVPSTVVVPAGANSVTFNISTTPVTAVKTVTVTAKVTAGEKTGTFRINP